MKKDLFNNRAIQVPTNAAPAVIWTKNFLLLCIANLCFFMSSHAFIPALPLYLVKIGGTQKHVGFIMGAFTLSSTLMRAIGGTLSDRFGRKRIMILGLVLMVIVCLSYTLRESVPYVAVLRIFHGMAFGLIATAISTMAADSLPPSRLSEGIGYFGLATTISMSLSPLLALWIVGQFTYRSLFFFLSGMVVVTLLCGLQIDNTRISARPSSPNSMAGTIANLLEKKSVLPSALAFCVSLVNSSMLFFVALFATALKVPQIGLFFASSSVCMAFSRPLSGRWADRGGANKVILLGLGLMAVSALATGLSQTLPGFILAGGLAGLGVGFSIPTLQSMAVQRAPAERRGAATGTFYAGYDMGLGLGAIAWGLIVQAHGYRSMYFAALIPLVLAGPIYWRLRKQPMDTLPV
jgi:MFS family permease